MYVWEGVWYFSPSLHPLIVWVSVKRLESSLVSLWPKFSVWVFSKTEDQNRRPGCCLGLTALSCACELSVSWLFGREAIKVTPPHTHTHTLLPPWRKKIKLCLGQSLSSELHLQVSFRIYQHTRLVGPLTILSDELQWCYCRPLWMFQRACCEFGFTSVSQMLH